MFAAAAKAFTVTPGPTTAIVRSGRPFVARFMSAGDDADRTVVDTCRDKISSALNTEDVKVTGAYDDPNGSHISVEVVSDMFEGKRAVQRQQLVYKAIWEEMQGAVHAVDSMVCKTPEEAK
eukprot:CAMPEP_0197455236 /NCGR_PEP_ID=MMETSP1175-20131217/40251_1 /TAXON_ID=1003142 /ORGANISM="Triceratium dubium, Strain CCMP147" /LENGTH=120 /DNA_ID=CAMNT_0042989035 /DNA_START=180 /DNA_END=542 /DNA_ORIENTATION=+